MKITFVNKWVNKLSLGFLMLVVYMIYKQGFSAGFQFDDPGSIDGVSAVKDWESALLYVFGGSAGTLGRPLSLLTFVLQKDSWPEEPVAFFQVNVFIHLFNGVLIYKLSCLIAKYLPFGQHNCRWFALAVTALWLSLPLHVSASLAAVQRMTTLATMFMLLGMVGYLSGRAMLSKAPGHAYSLMSISVVMGTVLALLCKENGALLPLYVLVLEVFLLSFAGGSVERKFKYWAWIFLGTPILLVAAYFVYKWPVIMGYYGFRDFTLIERLLTESRVLWDYLGHIIMPARSGTGMYHDDYPISRSLYEPAVLAALSGWLALCAIAWLTKKKYPVLLFALLWFFAGHVLESTFIPLELYFEHRNYLAAFGPIFALCTVIWMLPEKLLYIARGALGVLVLLNLFVLSETTELWGQPLLAAQLWTEEHPQSARAAQYRVRVYYYAGDSEGMRTALLEGHARIPRNIPLALHSVSMSCGVEGQEAFMDRIRKLEPVLANGVGESAGVEMLGKLIKAVEENRCPYLSYDQLHSMADLLLKNKYILANNTPQAALHVIKYRLYALQGKAESSFWELMAAYSFRKELDIALVAARVAARGGYPKDALALLQRTMDYAPVNPIFRRKWEKEIGALSEEIRQSKEVILKRGGQ